MRDNKDGPAQWFGLGAVRPAGHRPRQRDDKLCMALRANVKARASPHACGERVVSAVVYMQVPSMIIQGRGKYGKKANEGYSTMQACTCKADIYTSHKLVQKYCSAN